MFKKKKKKSGFLDITNPFESVKRQSSMESL